VVAFNTGERSEAISLYDWHRRMGRRCIKPIIDMANGAVTGLVLKDVPEDPPTLDSCPFCALTEAQRLPFKTGLEPLELVHGDLVGPMPVETISSDGCVIVIRSERLLIGSISESSSDESEPLSTRVLGLMMLFQISTITRSRKGSNTPSDHLHFSSRARIDKYASSFLDFAPGTPHSSLSPATQSPFSVARSQLLTYYGGRSPESVDGPAEQGDADTSIKSYEEREQRDWGARMGASPIQSPGIRIRSHSMPGSKTRSSPLRLSTRIQVLATVLMVVAPR